MYCCPNCFFHPWLKDYAVIQSTQTGKCPFCRSRNVLLTPLGRMAPTFDAMMSLYNELNADTILEFEDPFKVGGLLLNLVQEDWDIFSSRIVRAKRAGLLLRRLANYNWGDDSGEPQINLIDLYTRRVSWSHETLEHALESVIHTLN